MSRRRPLSAVPWTVGGLVREGERRFRAARLSFGHGTFSPRDEAALLALHAAGLATGGGIVDSARCVSPARARRALRLFDRRLRERKPAAYLTREAWLGGLPFYVDERVIIPRSHVAGMLLERLSPWLRRPHGVRAALDLCTGSGCLAVIVARAFPRAHVDAADISAAALAVANVNVRRYGLSRRIRLVESDLFSALEGKRYDLIVCNPPYVTEEAVRRLPPEYRHEPRLALAGGRDGLEIVRRILREARAFLTDQGLLVMEVGSGRARVERAFPRLAFTWPETPGGGDVLVVRRDQLPDGRFRRRASPATDGLRRATTRRTGPA